MKKPVLIVKPSFTVVGLCCTSTDLSEFGDRAMSELWRGFNGRADEIKGIVDRDISVGISIGFRDTFLEDPIYLVGYEVTEPYFTPRGMVTMEFPEAQYAVYEVEGGIGGLVDAYDYVFDDWLPGTPFSADDAEFDSMEVYSGDQLYLYIPISSF